MILTLLCNLGLYITNSYSKVSKGLGNYSLMVVFSPSGSNVVCCGL